MVESKTQHIDIRQDCRDVFKHVVFENFTKSEEEKKKWDKYSSGYYL